MTSRNQNDNQYSFQSSNLLRNQDSSQNYASNRYNDNQDFPLASRDKSLGAPHQNPGQNLRRNWDENNQPAEKLSSNHDQSDYRKENNGRNASDNALGSLWDGMGDNPRKKALLNDYQSYMKTNPLKPYQKHRQGQEYGQDDLSVKQYASEPASKDWYTQNQGVATLPGMGETRNQEFRPLQDKYANEASNSKIGFTPSASRLAGIGSRLLDNQRSLGQEGRGFSRGVMDDIPSFRSPQLGADRDPSRFNFATPQRGSLNNPLQLGRYQSFSNNNDPYVFGERRKTDFERKIESLNNLDNFQGPQGFGGEREGPKQSFHVKPQQEFNFGSRMGGDWQEQGRQAAREAPMNVKRGNEGSGETNNGYNWAAERQRQDEDKKLKQKDELQRIYREQIEEKKRKKEEEQRRQLLEDKKEEERLRKENEELQKEYQLEQQKKKGIVVEEPKPVYQPSFKEHENNDFLALGRWKTEKPKQQASPFDASGQSYFRTERPAMMDYYQDKDGDQTEDPDVQRIEALIKEASSKFSKPVISRPKFENTGNQEVKLNKGLAQYNSNLDEQLAKMKRDIEHHANLIKSEMSSYKKQAYDSLESRHHAQNELLQLREELKAQQIQAANSTTEDFLTSGEKGTNYKLGQMRSQDAVGLRIPNKNYAKIYIPEEEGHDLGAAEAQTLNVETQYVSAKGNQKYKELPKVEEMLHKFGNERNDRENAGSLGVNKNVNRDAAMEKFSMLFPSHGNKGQERGNEEQRGYENQEKFEYEGNEERVQQGRSGYDRQFGREEEGGIRGVSSYVSVSSTRNANNRFRQDKEEDIELPGSQELVEPR